MAFHEITAARLRDMIEDQGELAILDVREEADFARDGHLFLATPAPLGRISCMVQRLVPRHTTRIVLCDGGSGLLDQAALRLRELGFSDINLLRAPKEDWPSGGFEVFYGVNVPSKTFGEFVQEHDGTPDITPEDLDRLCRQDDVVLLDCRPSGEYEKGTIPGAINCPSSELVYRIGDLASTPTTTVVVNCAGRTRSIIGAQTLIAAGIPNPVLALRGGVMGWRLAGFEPGKDRKSPPAGTPSAERLDTRRAGAKALAEKAGVRTISFGEFQELKNRDESSSFLFDVRPQSEFLDGHLPGARNVLGVQLVQKADTHIGVMRSVVAVTDDTGVRAWVTAYWLARMGLWQVIVIDGTTCREHFVKGRTQPGYRLPRNLAGSPGPVALEPDDLAEALSKGRVVVIDLAPSNIYKDGHIPGAKYASPGTVDAHLAQFEHAVLTSPGGCLAELIAWETDHPVTWLKGGTTAWRDASLALEAGPGCYLDEPRDVFVRPYEQSSGQTEAMEEYLKWEVGLLSLLDKDRSVTFPVPS